jgi:hypothetical protein
LRRSSDVIPQNVGIQGEGKSGNTHIMDVHDALKRVFECSECYMKSFVAVETIINTSIEAIYNGTF